MRTRIPGSKTMPSASAPLRISGHFADPVVNTFFGIEANVIDRVNIGGLKFNDGVAGANCL